MLLPHEHASLLLPVNTLTEHYLVGTMPGQAVPFIDNFGTETGGGVMTLVGTAPGLTNVEIALHGSLRGGGTSSPTQPVRSCTSPCNKAKC